MDTIIDILKSKFLVQFATHPFSTCHLFLSAQVGESQAITKQTRAREPKEAFERAADLLIEDIDGQKIRFLRADWISGLESIDYGEWLTSIRKKKRGFFRYGFALPDFSLALTEQELNANGVFVKEADCSCEEGEGICVLNRERADALCQRRFGCPWPDLANDDRVFQFTTLGVFVEDGESPVLLEGTGIDSGLREIREKERFHTCRQMIVSACNHLLRGMDSQGRFTYCTMPLGTTPNTSYDIVRHLGAVYALLEAFALVHDQNFVRPITSAINAILHNHLLVRTLADGSRAFYVVSGDDVLLGGNAFCLLVLAHYSKYIHNTESLPIAEALARGILSLQQDDGSFIHWLSRDLAVKQKRVLVAFDGEAICALLALFAVNGDEELIRRAERAFAFVKDNAGDQADSPWLTFAAEALFRLDRRNLAIAAFGIEGIGKKLHEIMATEETAPVRLEQLLVAQQLSRLSGLPCHNRLLEATIGERVQRLFGGFFWPETAMFFSKPEALRGAFYAREHAFRVRIDDLHHAITALTTFLSTKQAAPKTKHPRPKARADSRLADAEIVFLFDGIPTKPVGIEVALFSRAEFFRSELGLSSTFGTCTYQPESELLLAHQVACGRVSQTPIVNLYDFLQDIDRSAPSCSALDSWSLAPDLQIKPIAGKKSHRILPPEGRALMYRGLSEETGILRFVNHLDNGTILRRDTYDPLGFLSRTAFLDRETGCMTHCIYYRPDHTPALFEYYTVKDKKSLLVQMQVLDHEGFPVQVFSSIGQAVAYWFTSVCAKTTKTILAIIDRADNYLDLSKKAAQPGVLSNLRIIKVIHTNHLFRVTHLTGEGDLTTLPMNGRFRYFSDPNDRTDILVTLTERQKRDVIRRFAMDNVVAIPHPVAKSGDLPKVSYDPRQVLIAARLFPVKGHDMALDVWKLVLEAVPDARLHLCGSSVDAVREHILRRARREGMEESIVYEGYREDMPEMFAKSAVSLCTSNFEGFPLSILESLQYGCPVVAVDCLYGPGAEIVDGVNGYLVSPGDIGAFANRVIQILTNPDLRQKLSHGCKNVYKRFSKGSIAKQWKEVLVQALARKP